MNVKHQFKILDINAPEEYRIIDMTDTRIVGVTECYDSITEADKSLRISRNKDIINKWEIGAKIVGYGVYIFLDADNSERFHGEEDYVRGIMRQMAAYFKAEVIDKNPTLFYFYELPKRASSSKPRKSSLKSDNKANVEEKSIESHKNTFWETIKQSKWMKGWRLSLIIALIVAIPLSFALFPDFWEFIGFLPFGIFMFIAYFDDMIKRK